MKKEYFTEAPPFINRQKEQEFLFQYFSATPKNILFLYGPKSTGKTTLIRKVLQKLDREKYNISFFNTREHFIIDLLSFRNLFFPENLKDKAQKMTAGLSLSVPGFSWKSEDLPMIKKDIFKTLIRKIEKLREEGIKPIIILDEFQYLRNIFVDDAKEVKLIEELFKFFIALTKQNNLAHVVCLTSDSYYMEELYNDTKLTNTSDFQIIEHLEKEDIYYWLSEKENCPEEMVDDIWENIGGSVWEIWQVFVSYKNTGDWKYKLNDLLQVKYSLLAEYYDEFLEEKWKNIFLRIITEISTHESYTIQRGERMAPLIKDLVSRDFWFFDMKTRTITANSKSFEKAMERILKEIS